MYIFLFVPQPSPPVVAAVAEFEPAREPTPLDGAVVGLISCGFTTLLSLFKGKKTTQQNYLAQIS